MTEKKLCFNGLIIPVLGQDIKVIEKKLKDNDGLYHPDSKTIELKPSLPNKEKISGLVHELAHATLDVLGVDFGNEMLEEIIVIGFERMIMSTFPPDGELIVNKFKK